MSRQQATCCSYDLCILTAAIRIGSAPSLLTYRKTTTKVRSCAAARARARDKPQLGSVPPRCMWISTGPVALRVATGWLVGACCCFGPLVYFWGRVLTRFYAVPESMPVLPTLPILVEEMNATGDFYGFLRRVREAFCERLRSGES